MGSASLHGQVYEKVFSFTDARNAALISKGAFPAAGLLQGSDGNFYGTTIVGGARNDGTVFKMTLSGVVTTLVEFTGKSGSNKGSDPEAGLVQGMDGNFYGTTYYGGASDKGTVFKMTPAGVLTTLVEFTGTTGSNKGAYPKTELVQAIDGNFYGTTTQGGASNKGTGTIFKMTLEGVLTTLVEFTGTSGSNKGSHPSARLVQGRGGNFYGTTQDGGASDKGTVFKMTPAGVLTTLVEFTGKSGSNKGSSPVSGLIQGSDGNFYGTTRYGGSSDYGTVFKMTPGGVLTTLMQFTGTSGSKKGAYPVAVLAQGSDGNFYGTTREGGDSDKGTVFKMTSDGVLTTLVYFTLTTGANPEAGLVLATDGNFYGTTVQGGASNDGTVFKMTQAGVLTTLVEYVDAGISNIGSNLVAGLVQGRDGNIYGTTYYGGASDYGTVFKLTPAGVLTTLVEFTGKGGSNKGGNPKAGLVQASDGNFYGTTYYGGASNQGTVFKMTPAGVLTTLVNFTGKSGSTIGSFPSAGLVQGRDSNFYGTAQNGGASDQGTVFKMTAAGVLTTLIEFTGTSGNNKGSIPAAELIQASDGNFYGTTVFGGSYDNGTVFKMTPSGMLTTLGEFKGSKNGYYPSARLVQASDGNFYGTTSNGGAGIKGTVYKITPGGGLTTLVAFTGVSESNKGGNPEAGLVQASDGNFYGTTYYGGASDKGTIFKMTAGGVLTTLVECVSDIYPSSPLIQAADGALYGTTRDSIYRLILTGSTLFVAREPQVQGDSSAIVQTGVNAAGSITSVSVEYGMDAKFPPNSFTSIPIVVNASGFVTKNFGTTLSNLIKGKIYYYRFRAKNRQGTTLSPVQHFTTLAEPEVTILPPTKIGPTSAQFNATVNSHNYDATVVFEWGTDGNTFPHTVNAEPGKVTGSDARSVNYSTNTLEKGTTYYYRVIATNVAGTVVSGSQSFTTLRPPSAMVSAPTAIKSSTAELNGFVNAHGTKTTANFEYSKDKNFPHNYLTKNAKASTATGKSDFFGEKNTAVSANLSGLDQGATYYYRIVATSSGGDVTSKPPISFSLDKLSGFKKVLPDAPLDAQGFVLVNLTPLGVGNWRFTGEQQWRLSGLPVGGLTTGNRIIEYRPVPGYIQPPLETAAVVSGEAPIVINHSYIKTSTVGGGSIRVTLEPQYLAAASVPEASRAQWRLSGEDDAHWRDSYTKDSDTTLSGMPPGNYLIECKQVGSRAAPNRTVEVKDKQISQFTLIYLVSDAVKGTGPSPVNFDIVKSAKTEPYAYVGQIRSDAGSSSGFVVKRRVVATAGHVVFDDSTLSNALGLQWLFQRDSGTYEPTPLIPRGSYIYDGYATQRIKENTPGSSLPASQNLDVAVLYFLEDAGRSGYGGYLASDASENEFLLSTAQKMLVGYPVESIAPSDQGRMHATPHMNVEFTPEFRRTYITQDIHSTGGMSGGPLCVQLENGEYYPAAIYLGGTGQTVVRTIDSQVIDLFKRAEDSANLGDNNTGGGITHASAVITITGASDGPGALKITILPEAAAIDGRWWLNDEASRRHSGSASSGRIADDYTLNFSPVSGFKTPASQTVHITGGQLKEITFTYAEETNALAAKAGTGLSAAAPTLASAAMPQAKSLLLAEATPESAVTTVEVLDGVKYLSLTVTKTPGPHPRRIVEVSPNLLDWYSGRQFTTVMQNDAYYLRTRDNTPLRAGTKRFIRLKGN